MPGTYYLIDEKLSVKPLTAYLSHQGASWTKDLALGELENTQVVGKLAQKALPITQDGQLLPGVLYESSADPNTRFYLPEYQLNVVGGQYTTRLKWRSPEDDPNGPLAFLTVEVVARPVLMGDLELQEIPHQAVARIAYQMPVRDREQATEVNLAAFLGNWSNLDLNTGGMTRLEILPLNERQAQFHAFGKCSPVDCDWGLAEAHVEDDALVGTYDFGFKQTKIVVRRHNNLLAAELFHRFAPQDGRPNRIEHETLAGGNLIENSADDRPVLWIEVGALEPIGGGVRRARLPIATKLDFDRLYQVITDSNFNSRLDIRCFAIAGRRTLRQVVLDRFDLVTRKRFIPPQIAPDTILGEPPAPGEPRLEAQTIEIAPNLQGLHDFQLNQWVVQPKLDLGVSRPLPVLRPSKNLSEILASSDLQVKVGNRQLNAIPNKAILSEDGYPALIEIPVESGQIIAPFWFLPATHAYIFDLPGNLDPGPTHILIRMEIRNGTGQVLGIFYQDSAFSDQFYYQPQEFRVPRLETPPYLPDLRVAFVNLVTEANGTASDTNNASALHYKVLLGYRALPHIDPLLLDLAQQQVPNVKAHFSALAPASTQLMLRLPEDETGGALTEIVRPNAQVRFDQGLVDEIELSQSEFERIFSFFQSASGIGVEGAVTAALLGNLTAQVPVRLSLKQTTGSVLSHTYLGPQTNGMHRVRLLNRIESSVTVVALYRVALGGGAFAFPQAVAGIELPPNGQFDLDYRVEPADAVVADISPAYATSISADPQRLWPRLFINQGYTSDTFPLRITIEPDFFGVIPPGGTLPLSAVEVRFSDGTVTKLSAGHLQADVVLRMPLLPRLLGSDQAKQYRYRVTNLLGSEEQPGATSEELEGEGETPLPIVPVGG